MFKNKLRYLIVSIVALLATVGTANAVGVFYYDSANREFVLDSSLRILDPGNFRLFIRELNASVNDHLYINGNKDVQVRIDSDQAGTADASLFKINNGANTTVFSVSEDSFLKLGSNVAPGAAASGTTFQIDGAGNINKVLQITASGNISTTGNITTTAAVISPYYRAFAGAITSGVNSWTPSIALGQGEAIVWGSESDGAGAKYQFGHTTGGNGFHWGSGSGYLMNLADDGSISLLGNGSAWPTAGTSWNNQLKMKLADLISWNNTGGFGYTSTGFYWSLNGAGNAYPMALDTNGNLVVRGTVTSSAGLLGAGGGTTPTLTCTTDTSNLGAQNTSQSLSCATGDTISYAGCFYSEVSNNGSGLLRDPTISGLTVTCAADGTAHAQVSIGCCKIQ